MADRRAPLANEIIARHAGRDAVDAGTLVTVDVDHIYVQDGNSPTIARLFELHAFDRVFDPARITFVFDHSVIVPDRDMADRLKAAREFARSLGVAVHDRGEGISHVLALEEGWFQPGAVVLGSDSHTCTGGAVQALGLGMGASDIAAAMVTGTTWLRVPETVWLRVSGRPHPSVRAKDVALEVLRRFDQNPFLYRSVEWTGSWAETLTMDSAASVASMAVEMGAKCAFLPAGAGRPPGMGSTEPLPGGTVLDLSVEGMTPRVALPHSPFDAVPLRQASGQPIDYVFIGSCTNSRLEDIAEATRVLGGSRVHPHVHCLVTPGSRSIWLEASRRGYIDALTEAGALVTPPGCGACVGTQGSIPAGGERVLSTMNRNFRGRMGNPDAEILLSSPLVAATAAVLGHVPSLEELPIDA